MRIKKIVLYTTLGVLGLVLLLAGVGTIGLKEAKNLDIQSVDLTSLEDGEYTGEYNNFRWSNKVIITIDNNEITSIESIEKTKMDSQYAVIEEIMEIIIEEQDIDIDTVSGASATTKSFLKAVEDALVED